MWHEFLRRNLRICFKAVWMLLGGASPLAEPLFTDFMLRKTSHYYLIVAIREDGLMSANAPQDITHCTTHVRFRGRYWR